MKRINMKRIISEKDNRVSIKQRNKRRGKMISQEMGIIVLAGGLGLGWGNMIMASFPQDQKECSNLQEWINHYISQTFHFLFSLRQPFWFKQKISLLSGYKQLLFLQGFLLAFGKVPKILDFSRIQPHFWHCASNKIWHMDIMGS